jgi:hypothetical protein
LVLARGVDGRLGRAFWVNGDIGVSGTDRIVVIQITAVGV